MKIWILFIFIPENVYSALANYISLLRDKTMLDQTQFIGLFFKSDIMWPNVWSLFSTRLLCYLVQVHHHEFIEKLGTTL